MSSVEIQPKKRKLRVPVLLDDDLDDDLDKQLTQTTKTTASEQTELLFNVEEQNQQQQQDATHLVNSGAEALVLALECTTGLRFNGAGRLALFQVTAAMNEDSMRFTLNFAQACAVLSISTGFATLFSYVPVSAFGSENWYTNGGGNECAETRAAMREWRREVNRTWSKYQNTQHIPPLSRGAVTVFTKSCVSYAYDIAALTRSLIAAARRTMITDKDVMAAAMIAHVFTERSRWPVIAAAHGSSSRDKESSAKRVTALVARAASNSQRNTTANTTQSIGNNLALEVNNLLDAHSFQPARCAQERRLEVSRGLEDEVWMQEVCDFSAASFHAMNISEKQHH